MCTIIASDLHLGSRHCAAPRFMRLLDALPRGATLVLNGDTVDRWHPRLPPEHMAVVDRLRREALSRRVVLIRGNHDRHCPIRDPGRIEFLPGLSVDRRLYVAHGHDFDSITCHKLVLCFFRVLYQLRDRFASESVHVAFYAKRFPVLYGLLRRRVMKNAAAYARRNGYAAVACGHTHFVEEAVFEGTRYFNTGSWTETPRFCLHVTGDAVRLVAEDAWLRGGGFE